MEFLILSLALLVIVLGGMAIYKFLTTATPTEFTFPYNAKKYFFSRSEQEFLRLLNEAIDRQKYTIFPKVRLADFIEVDGSREEYQGALNKIKSKHVDFLVWDIVNGKVALAIELDGKSHQNKNAQERDEFKNKLYEHIEVPLERIRVGTDFAAEIKRINTLL